MKNIEEVLNEISANGESRMGKSQVKDSQVVQRLIKFLTTSVRKHDLTQQTLRYIYRSTIKKAGLTVPKKAKKLYRLPKPEELEKFFNAFTDIQNRLMFQVMLVTGGRCAEIASIECDKICYATNTILIRGKGNKERLLILTPRIAELIKCFLAQTKSRKYLFTNRLYKPFSVRRIEQICQDTKKAAGISAAWTPHSLRHYTLSHLTGKNLSLSLVQRVGGHENIQTTQIYQNLGVDGSRDIIVEKLQELERSNLIK